MLGRMSTGTPPTEFKFTHLLLSAPVTLVNETPAKKDHGMLEQQAGIQVKNVPEP
jgi:hypothetical protein